MPRPKSIRLSIYLIREDFKDDDSILRPVAEVQEDHESKDGQRRSVAIDGVGTLYYVPSAPKTPSWLAKFFGSGLPKLGLFTSIAKAALLVRVNVSGKKARSFAVCFGHGYLLLNPAAIEERFGLRTVLNVVDPDSLRRIDKKNHGATPKDAHEQVSQASGIAAFGIDVEQDLIRGIAGETKDERFGKTISGKDALSVSVPVGTLDIHEFLKLCFEKYLSDQYKTHFPWIDHIEEVKRPSLIAMLDERLVERLKSDNPGHMWMAVPDLIDWDDVSGFKYSRRKRDDARSHDDVQLQDFLSSLTKEERSNISVELLKQKQVFCLSASADRALRTWRAYNCIYCEEVDAEGGKVYLLSNSKWYEVEGDYAKEVNDEYRRFRDLAPTCSLPVFDPKGDPKYDEGDYNLEVSKADPSFIWLDGPTNIIRYGGPYGSVEVCDLYSGQKQFIHVKRYGSSRVLSHLFSQGVVPGELFLMAQDFRAKVNDKLPASHKLADLAVRPNAGEYEVVFAIVSSKKAALEVPFFSKVSLRTARRHLELLCGYKVSLLKVETVDAK